MARPRFILLAALSVLAVGAACGGGDDGGEEASQPASSSAVEITAKEFAFSPKEITVAAGRATTIKVKNLGSVEHDITIDDPAFKVAAQATKTGEAKLTLPAAGSYTFYCSVPGHRVAGMEGTVSAS